MLKEKLTDDLKQAMKSADQETVGVLRILLTAIKNKEIEKRTKTGNESQLSDDEIIQTMMSEAKKRKESIEIFTKGERKDLADKEMGELVILQKYLPKQLSETEVELVVDKVLKEISAKDFGSVMKEAMKELKGKADGKIVSEIIQRKLKQ